MSPTLFLNLVCFQFTDQTVELQKQLILLIFLFFELTVTFTLNRAHQESYCKNGTQCSVKLDVRENVQNEKNEKTVHCYSVQREIIFSVL